MPLLASTPPFSLDLCLESGQAFGWRKVDGAWAGAIGQTAFLLRGVPNGLEWDASGPAGQASMQLQHYLALGEDHPTIVRQFPRDPFLMKAVRCCGGLRVLRQDPWECLAGFILSSTKQIAHIQQIWRNVALRWGTPMKPCGGDSSPIIHSFPGPSTLARRTEAELRGCAMGFRAPYLLEAARAVDGGTLNLETLRSLSTGEARGRLMALHGVGRKIADCVLLFSLGKSEAFPVDTWILKVLRHVYFRGKRKVTAKRLVQFAAVHFGPFGGHAQQYLFHYARMNPGFAREKMRRIKNP